MIDQNFYDTCVALTRPLSERGVMLVPRPGSILQAAVSAANPLAIPDSIKDSNRFYREHTVAITNTATELVTPYESIINEAVEKLKGPVLAHIQYAKNVVKPAVKNLYDKLMAVVQESPITEAGESIEIVGYTSPRFVEDQFFKDTYNMYKRPCEMPFQLNFMKDATNEEIADLLKSGSSRLDKEIYEWIESSNISAYDIWVSLFSAASGESAYKRVTLQGLTAKNYYEAAGYFAIAFLMASRILSGKMVTKSIFSSEREFTTAVTNLLSYVTYRLDVCMRESEMLEKNKVVVLNHSPSERTIRVVYSNYREWSEGGSSPDILLGAFATNASERTIPDLNAKAEFLIREWKRHSDLIGQVERRKTFEILRTRILSETMLDALTHRDAIEAEFHRTHSLFESELKRRVTEYVNLLTPENLTKPDELFTHCMTIIAGIRFGFTPAFSILKSMIEITSSQTMDVRESATAGSFEYIASYLLTQVEAKAV